MTSNFALSVPTLPAESKARTDNSCLPGESDSDLIRKSADAASKIPVAEEAGVVMAIHPDDPPWPIFGLPRIITDEAALERLVHIVDSPSNGITFCTGSLGPNSEVDLIRSIRTVGAMGRIHLVHARNIKRTGEKSFRECEHSSGAGDVNLYEVIKALVDIGFTGAIRPDHGRMIWGERGKPGYGLYDRALGAMYLAGLWEAIEKTKPSS